MTQESEPLGGLTFDEASHRYTYDGAWVPSVTQALKAANLVDYSGLDPFFAERGRQVHRACQLAIQGRLVREKLDPAVAGRVAAWNRMMAEMNPNIIENELRMGSSALLCAGTLDLVVEHQGKLWIWDIKSGDFGKEAWGIQTAGYHLLYRVCSGTLVVNRGIVRLFADGTYKIITIPTSHLAKDIEMFKACVLIAQWKGEACEI